MRLTFIGAAALVLSIGIGAARAGEAVKGDYVEARNANIYAGACHHEGEVTTAGRDAMLAWNIHQGEYQGVTLDGVKLIAVVTADRNFEIEGYKSRSVIYVDTQASAAQRDAAVALVRSKAARVLGQVLAVKSVPITFTSTKKRYEVSAKGVAYMKVEKETGDICCLQPRQYWGKPFISLKNAKAGFSHRTSYQDKSLIVAWAASKMNSAYFGAFSF